MRQAICAGSVKKPGLRRLPDARDLTLQCGALTPRATPPTMEWLKTIGIAGFMFFLLKGLAWLVVFALISRGVIPKKTLAKWRMKWRGMLGKR
jgi:hypothetical protein